MSCSEVARIRAQIEAEYQAARLGLCGVAMVARHEMIMARQVRIAVYFEELAMLAGEDVAARLVIEVHDGSVGRRDNEATPLRLPDAKRSPGRDVGSLNKEGVGVGVMVERGGVA